MPTGNSTIRRPKANIKTTPISKSQGLLCRSSLPISTCQNKGLLNITMEQITNGTTPDSPEHACLCSCKAVVVEMKEQYHMCITNNDSSQGWRSKPNKSWRRQIIY